MTFSLIFEISQSDWSPAIGGFEPRILAVDPRPTFPRAKWRADVGLGTRLGAEWYSGCHQGRFHWIVELLETLEYVFSKMGLSVGNSTVSQCQAF